MNAHNTDEASKVWQFFIEGDEILVCFPRDAIADLGEHVHLRLNGPMAMMVGGGLLHLLEDDKESGGELWGAIEKEVANERLPA
jgi:hypothetical protein